MRSSAIKGLLLQATASASGNVSSHALGQGLELSSHAVEGAGDIDSHAVSADQALPSHAVELEEVPSFALGGQIDSPQSSVGSVAGEGRFNGADMRLDLSQLDAYSPKRSSPLDSMTQSPYIDIPAHLASRRDTARTPLSSHAVPAASTDSDSQMDTGRTPLSSHAVNPSSSSGSGSEESPCI